MAVLAKIDEQLAKPATLKGMMQLELVQERGITNYLSASGLPDTPETRKVAQRKFENIVFSYLELMEDKPDLKKLDRFQHLKSVVKIMRFGVPFEHIYVMPGPNGTIKIDNDPASKRALLEKMPTIERVPEAHVVCKGDVFVFDELNDRITKHEKTEKSPEPDKITLDVIMYSYQRIKFKDGHIEDVVINKTKLLKAKSKSPGKSEAAFWGQFPEDACKKVATNRAFRIHHKWPDDVVLFPGEKEEEKREAKEEEEEVVEVSHTVENAAPMVEAKVTGASSEAEEFLK